MAESVKCILTQQGKYISGSLPESNPITFIWGDEPTDSPGSQDGVGNETWWIDLNYWITHNSTESERQSCVGKSKRIVFSSPFNGLNAIIVQCIGADQDGPNTLTFQSKNVTSLENTVGVGSIMAEESTAFMANSFFNSINVIKKVPKSGSILTYLGDSTFEAYSDLYTWWPSAQEMGIPEYASLEEYTEGYPNYGYSYYKNVASKIKHPSDIYGNSATDSEYIGYWTRTSYTSVDIASVDLSRASGVIDDYSVVTIGLDGTWGDVHADGEREQYGGKVCPALAFVIGVPSISPRGKKSSRFTIGTSSSGYIKENCDYLCDGTADDVEINTAIANLPDTGGEIILLDGTYNITSQININKPNVVLSGNGRENTKLIRKFEDSDNSKGIIRVVENSIIQDLSIDGNKTNFPTYNNTNIYVSGSDNTISRCRIDNSSYYGIYLTSNSNYNTIENNSFSGQDAINILLFGDQNNNINDNVINEGQYGIYMIPGKSTTNKNNIISGNICSGAEQAGICLIGAEKNSISGNICSSKGAIGIALNGPSDGTQALVKNNVVSGNICNENNSYGIWLNCAHENNVVGNNCSKNNQCGIVLGTTETSSVHSENNLISGNICQNNQYFNILLTGGSSNNTISDNNCTHTVTLADMHTIALTGADNNYNFITGNTLGRIDYISEGGEGNYFFNNFKISFNWGQEATDSPNSQDGVGDEKWWANLNSWVVSSSTEQERQTCVGKTKRLAINPTALNNNSSYVIMQCIGADQDGPNTLTFQSKNVWLSTDQSVSSDIIDGSRYWENYSQVAGIAITTNSFIKKIVKRTYNAVSYYLKYSTEIWQPSFVEMGISVASDYGKQEYTEGYPITGYSYYKDDNSRIKYLADSYGNSTGTVSTYCVRSNEEVAGNISRAADYWVAIIDETGQGVKQGRNRQETYTDGYAFAFTVGASSVDKMWGAGASDSANSQDGIGDQTWWDNLAQWVSYESTPKERQACVGRCKRLAITPSGANGNASYVIMQCIGADQDGPNTLTFQSKNIWGDYSAFWVREDLLREAGIAISTDNFIRPVIKKSIGTLALVWNLSSLELGLGPDNGTDYTVGYPMSGYSYYKDNTSRIKYGHDRYGNSNDTAVGYMVRSVNYTRAANIYSIIAVSSTGELEDVTLSYYEGENPSYNAAFGFVVAAPEPFYWGDEPTDQANSTDGVGDTYWWKNLNKWVIEGSTEQERQACVGKTKRLAITPSALNNNASYVIMQCIGADQDGPNTLTFQSKNIWLSTDQSVNSDIIDGSRCWENYSQVAGIAITTNSFIKKIVKRTYNAASYYLKYSTEIWQPSFVEMGISVTSGFGEQEYTEGYPMTGYSYYKDDNSRIKYLADSYGNSTGTASIYFVRSDGDTTNISRAADYWVAIIDETGQGVRQGRNNYETYTDGYAFAFTVGISNVDKIWEDEPTDSSGSKDGTGDLTWWSNLNNWVNNGSTVEERVACIGKTKRFMSSDGTQGLIMICIGADQDGPHTLTFQSKTVGIVNSGLNPTSGLCNDLASAFPILNELTSKIDMNLIKIRGTTEYNVSTFAISGQEAGNGIDKGEYTKGYPNNGYSYFTDNNARIRYSAVDSYGNTGEAVNWGIAGEYADSRAADLGQSVFYTTVSEEGAFTESYTGIGSDIYQDVAVPCTFAIGQNISI